MKRLYVLLITVLLAAFSLPLHAQWDKDVFSFRGRSALAEGRLADAITNFNILAQLDSTDYYTFFFRGIAKYNLGDIRGARRDFDTAIRLNPVFTSGYHYRAITSSRFGNYEDALGDLEKAISLRPGYEGLYFTRGVTFFMAHRFDDAVKDFNYYIRKQPRESAAYLNRGASYLFLGDTLSALKDYNKAIKLDRFEPSGYIRRARLEAERGNNESALEDLTKAIELDNSNTLAYFTRAIVNADLYNYREALEDLNAVLEREPGNALTLYNRSLLYAQLGNYEGALEDMDRVISINPRNVLAYFNRASYFVAMGRWADALADYNSAIDLYPDFARAYLNRSWVELQMGMRRASREDYRIAEQKIREFREKSSADAASFADTTRKYSSLLSLDADFARTDFDDEMLQYRDVDVKLRPLYKFILSGRKLESSYATLDQRYENPLLSRFISELSLPVELTQAKSDNQQSSSLTGDSGNFMGLAEVPEIPTRPDSSAMTDFLCALADVERNQFNSALMHYDKSLQETDSSPYASYYRAFYYMNRAVLRAEMIDFIASIESSVPTLTMDDSGHTRARVSEQVTRGYDYSEAVADMEAAAEALGNIPHIWFNLGNLYCLSSRLVEAIGSYDKAISLYPYMGDAYFNRGLILIYLKDKDKGCIDLSRAGELGVGDAYSIIARYCEEEEQY